MLAVEFHRNFIPNCELATINKIQANDKLMDRNTDKNNGTLKQLVKLTHSLLRVTGYGS